MIDIKTSTVTYSNGSVYEGALINLQRNGKGRMTNANKDVYTGDFVNDRQTGTGTIAYSNGDIYEGGFVDGKKQGYGKYTRAKDGSVYRGLFQKQRQARRG